jgi:Ca2+/Na+ antiporter
VFSTPAIPTTHPLQILLIFVVISAFMIGLLFSGWKLTKKLGAGLIAWYCVYMSFVILSEVGIISL